MMQTICRKTPLSLEFGVHVETICSKSFKSTVLRFLIMSMLENICVGQVINQYSKVM